MWMQLLPSQNCLGQLIECLSAVATVRKKASSYTRPFKEGPSHGIDLGAVEIPCTTIQEPSGRAETDGKMPAGREGIGGEDTVIYLGLRRGREGPAPAILDEGSKGRVE